MFMISFRIAFHITSFHTSVVAVIQKDKLQASAMLLFRLSTKNCLNKSDIYKNTSHHK